MWLMVQRGVNNLNINDGIWATPPSVLFGNELKVFCYITDLYRSDFKAIQVIIPRIIGWKGYLS